MPKKFEFYEPGQHNPRFTCQLESEQCESVRQNGVRCRNKTVIGIPYCWQHLLREKHLRIKDSTLPNAGKGLFAMDKSRGENDIIFRRYDEIIEYNGERLSEAELDERYGEYTAPYAVEVNRDADIFEDGACVRGVGAIANHRTGRNNNAELYLDVPNNRVVIRATRNIKNGAEIFVNYGTDYRFTEGTRYQTK